MGEQYVGIDLHRRRSVIVRMTGEGEVLETVRVDNDPVALSLEVDIDSAGLPISGVATSLHSTATEDAPTGLRVRLNPGERADRVILDMLAPWECLEAVAGALRPGGIVCAYVATTTQLGRLVETLRTHGGFTEPQAWESLVRPWHVEGLAIRPDHRMVGHTGFLVTARRMAPGHQAPLRQRRPAPGAYGPDYSGPRPPGT